MMQHDTVTLKKINKKSAWGKTSCTAWKTHIQQKLLSMLSVSIILFLLPCAASVWGFYDSFIHNSYDPTTTFKSGWGLDSILFSVFQPFSCRFAVLAITVLLNDALSVTLQLSDNLIFDSRTLMAESARRPSPNHQSSTACLTAGLTCLCGLVIIKCGALEYGTKKNSNLFKQT